MGKAEHNPPQHDFHPLRWNALPETEQCRRARTFLDTMRSRRSVRQFSRRSVPWQVVEDAVQAAGLAPSGANQQPWTFVAVGDPVLKRRIREAAEAEERENYERRMPEEWLAALAPLGTDWHKPHLEDAPYLIVVFEQVSGLERDESGASRRVKHYYPKESVGIAVGFLLAGLHHAGLASLVHTPSPMHFLREALGRPENERAFCVIPVGYPAEGARLPAIGKKALNEILIRME